MTRWLVIGLLAVAACRPCSPWGDADGDGRITAADPDRILACAVGTATCDPAADVDRSGRVDPRDALFVAAFLDGQRPPVPVGICPLQ